MAVITEIIEQHAEETAFNWLLRDRAVYAPHYNLQDLSRLDDRIEANIDGLRIAGDEGWRICHEAMAMEEAGEIFSAGVIAFESKVPDRMDAMLASVEKELELQRALVSALGWIDFNQIADPVFRLLGADLSFLKLIGLSALAVHRQDPGAALADFLTATDIDLRARALKTVGELGRLDLLPQVLPHLSDSNEKCRFFAGWSAAVCGHESGGATLQSIAEANSFYSVPACMVAIRKMAPTDARFWLEGLQKETLNVRLILCGFGSLGDSAAIPRLIGEMHVPESARPACEAFSMITGVDITEIDLEGEQPKGFESGPTENPEDKDIDMDPDEDLPWPDPELIQKWWDANKKDFPVGKRYLAGAPISPEHCRQVLINGNQRQRIAASLELAIMNPGQALFETRTPGFRQQTLLGFEK